MESAALPGVARDLDLVRRLYWCVGFPSLIAGFTTAWTSANGAINAGVGLAPAAVVTMVMLALIVAASFGAHRVCAKAASIVTIGCVLLTIIFFQFKYVYGEGPPTGLTARIETGPFWGIATTELKAALSRALVQDLSKYGGKKRILFYDFFPAGYLFGSSCPGSLRLGNTVRLAQLLWAT